MSILLKKLFLLSNHSEMQELEKQLLPGMRVFVDNDALAFFDVNKLANELIDVAEIKGKSMKELHGQPYNFLVKGIDYFRIGDCEGPLNTVSVTTPCIVFCAYTTDENGRIKSSGVYHAASLPPKKSFQKSLYKLIDTVRPSTNEPVTVKGAGNNSKEEKLQKIRNHIINYLDKKGVEITPEHLLLGGGGYRITEFHPLTGELITYFSKNKQKTVL